MTRPSLVQLHDLESRVAGRSTSAVVQMLVSLLSLAAFGYDFMNGLRRHIYARFSPIPSESSETSTTFEAQLGTQVSETG